MSQARRSNNRARQRRSAPRSGASSDLTRDHYRELGADAAKLAASEEGREFLTYLVNCALTEEQGTFAIVDGVRHEFAGSLGMAPDWLDRPLTEVEQRWVTAGILARTNFFGVEVTISMRHPERAIACLDVSEQERAEFTLCEGDFFGNIFADPPVACVAAAPRRRPEREDPVFQVRVGTEIDAEHDAIDGKPVSRCGFVITGNIRSPDVHRFGGVTYNEFVRVYLKPRAKADRRAIGDRRAK